jgi:hypothetical protein
MQLLLCYYASKIFGKIANVLLVFRIITESSILYGKRHLQSLYGNILLWYMYFGGET